MYYTNCEWYVDMGEHNKPLCERKSLRPAKCSECPVYIRSIEDENTKLRELVRTMMQFFEDGDWCDKCDHARECDSEEQYEDDCLMRFVFRDRMRELGVEEDACIRSS